MKTGSDKLRLGILFALVSFHFAVAAETLDSLIAGAKKEPEFTFIAGAQTFGGQKNLSLLESAFNKKFGLNMQDSFQRRAGDERHGGAGDHRAQDAAPKRRAISITARSRISLCCTKRRRWTR